MNDNFKHSDVTGKIIKAFYKVYNTLGYGFLEKVYHNALMIELPKHGLKCTSQFPVNVYYDKIKVGVHFADIVADNCVIIEIKAASAICEDHEAQLTNYLKGSDIEVGLPLNFGTEPGFKRKVFSDIYKNHHKP